MKNRIILILLIPVLLILVTTFVSTADFGYDNPTLPNVPTPEVTIVTFQNNTGAVNKSDYWDNMDTINATQMEDSGGILNILESWLGSLYCKLTGCDISGNLNVTGNVTIGTKDSPSYFKAFIGDGDSENIALFSDPNQLNGIMISTYAIDGVSVDSEGEVDGYSDLYVQYWSTGDVYIAEEGGDIYMGGASGAIYSNLYIGASKFFFNGTSGFLGIGTQKPTHELNVIGDINFTGNLIGSYSTYNATYEAINTSFNIESLVNSTYVNVVGDTMTGNLDMEDVNITLKDNASIVSDYSGMRIYIENGTWVVAA